MDSNGPRRGSRPSPLLYNEGPRGTAATGKEKESVTP